MSCAIWCETSLISSGSILNIMYIATMYVVCVTSQGLSSLYSNKRPYGLLLFVYISINSIQFKSSGSKSRVGENIHSISNRLVT